MDQKEVDRQVHSLDLRQVLEDSPSHLVPKGCQIHSCGAIWGSINRKLPEIPFHLVCQSTKALLTSVEPGLDGMLLAFVEFPAEPERQQARALWLTLLAELAERGELTWEGLVP